MKILAAYALVGIAVCAVVACRDDKSDRRGELPLSMLFDPIWPIIFFWPLWLAVVLVERSFPKEPRFAASVTVDLVGKAGVVVTDLRPLGRIQIGAAHFDARSDGRIIPAGSAVRVVSRSMAEFLVEQEPNKAPEPTTTSVTSPAAQEPRQP